MFNLIGKLADDRGRKALLVITLAMFFIGGIIQTAVPHISVIIGSCFVLGLGCSLATVVLPVYLGEMAPYLKMQDIGVCYEV